MKVDGILQNAQLEPRTSDPSDAPGKPGKIWYRTDTGAVCYDDGALIQSLLLPTGIVVPFGGATAPSGWLLCDGSQVSQTTYAKLFSLIGTTYNIGGETAGMFRVPDLRGRTVIGVGSGAGLTPRTLGAKLGEETHQLTVTEMPSHAHGVSDNHQHKSPSWNAGQPYGGAASEPNMGLYTNQQTATPSLTSTTAVGSITVNSTGGDGAHNNMQPSLVMTCIIKT